ncbi:PulJ/GspJ family protein [Actinoplanes regularis]|uniref:PulJ/GspJ family protein n=1 Tax=Actinoplanes regularis TaxID=52697 RepID=UPI0024A001BE|nr:hypothetical protein [Actinoplanes regularis]GLW32858.1 hypothetical protein Areg01_57960 [Actinoplanes regularis]
MSDDNRTPADDEGFSLIDLIVATSIMSFIMVLVTGAIIVIYSNVNRADGLSTARSQLGNSFRRLDREIRYATWVSTPGEVGTGWYLEYATKADTKSVCRQLAFKNGALTTAEWDPQKAAAPSARTTIAGDLAQTGTVAPFTVYTPGNRPYASASPGTSGVGRSYELEHHQVRLRFSGKVGTTDLPLDVLFTAQNTNRNTPALNDCSKGRPTV